MTQTTHSTIRETIKILRDFFDPPERRAMRNALRYYAANRCLMLYDVTPRSM